MSQILTTDELAARWKMDAKTLSNWRMKGRGPAWFKLGDGRNALVRYREEDVLAFEQSQAKEKQ